MSVNSQEHSISTDRRSHGEDAEEPSVSRLVGEIGDHVGENKGCGPRWNGDQLSPDRGILVALDDGGSKISVAVSTDETTEVSESSEVDLVVFEEVEKIMALDFPLQATFALVCRKTRANEEPLFLGEPFGIFREIWNDEEPAPFVS